jgi:hypothetical protein
MLDKLKKKLRNAFVAFSYGLKNTEADILGQKTTTSESNSIEQKMQQNDLAEALLKGEVTEQVEILRDRTYLVSDESKKYKVIIDTVGTSKAYKKMAKKIPPKTFNEDGYEIAIVMDNNAIPSSVLEGLEAVGGYGIKNNYPLTFEYEYIPKYHLEEYVKRIVIRVGEAEEDVLLDLYIPKYTDSYERLEKIFDNEINKVKNNNYKPLHLEFKTVSFISDKAFGTEDLIFYEYKFKKFIGVNEFDGKYVLTYRAEPSGDNEKITKKYKNKKLRDAYENKEKRGTKLDLGNEKKEKHKCEKCGKEVESNYDFRITKSTIGIGVCQKCLADFNKKK